MSPNEKKLWIEWSKIDRTTAKLYDDVKKGKATEDHNLQDLLMLGLYVYNHPRRNDYHNMKMGTGSDQNMNYCDLKKGMFVFNEYKTAKWYKTQEIPISKRLQKIIHLHQKRFNYDFLVAPVELSTSQFTDLMKVTTKRMLGKPLGSRMLRKIYITFTTKKPLEEMMKRAKEMGHNWKQSLRYIRV